MLQIAVTDAVAFRCCLSLSLSRVCVCVRHGVPSEFVLGRLNGWLAILCVFASLASLAGAVFVKAQARSSSDLISELAHAPPPPSLLEFLGPKRFDQQNYFGLPS